MRESALGLRNAVAPFLGTDVAVADGLLDLPECFYDVEESNRRAAMAREVLDTLDWFLDIAQSDPLLHFEIACARNHLAVRVEEFERSLEIVASLAATAHQLDLARLTTR